MKLVLSLVVIFFLVISCQDSDSCLQQSGDSISKTLTLESFDEIDIPKGVSVEIIDANEYRIEINSKENYYSNLNFQVLNNQLIIKNEMSCSMLHDYKIASIKIFTPTLSKIISRTQFEVSSVGVLHYPNLELITSLETESASSVFNLNVNNQVLRIIDNQVGYFKIQGKTVWLDIALYGGNGKVDAKNLSAYDCTFFQRSNNDILVNASNKLQGTIYSVGNVQVYSVPDSVEVVQKYTGKLIYN